MFTDEKRESPHGTSPVAEVRPEPRNDPSSVIQSVIAVKHTDFVPPPPAGKKQRCRDYDGECLHLCVIYFSFFSFFLFCVYVNILDACDFIF